MDFISLYSKKTKKKQTTHVTALQIIKLSGTKLIYRIMAVLKIETCIVTSVAVSLMGQTVIL